jgi:pimeloyl-ACP methyl ester carboxylesterase
MPFRIRRWWLWPLALLPLGYTGLVAYLVVQQDELIFKPPKTGALYPASLGLQPERVPLAGPGGIHTVAWRIRPAGPALVPYWIVFLHGNSSSIATRENVRRYDQLRALGLNVLAPEYPGFGEVGGPVSEAGMLAAARAAYDHLRRTQSVPGSQIAIYGWSLGSGAAVPLARDVDEAALILEGAFSSVLRRAQATYPFLPISLMVHAPFLSEDAIPRSGSPLLSLHSPTDAIIPIDDGRRLFAAARHPKTFVELAGGHITPNADDADRYLAAIHRFLGERAGWTLRPPRRSAALAVRTALERGGIGAAVDTWRRCLAEGAASWNLAEYELAHLGRSLSLADRHDEAIALQRLNLERFGDSPLAWYELGRALARGDRPEEARAAFDRSIALEPASINPSYAARSSVR